VEWVVVDNEAVVHDIERRVVHRLNASATSVWLAIDGHTSAANIAAAFIALHPQRADDVERDVYDALDALAGVGVVRWRGAGRGHSADGAS
jgi:hypothetical protein